MPGCSRNRNRSRNRSRTNNRKNRQSGGGAGSGWTMGGALISSSPGASPTMVNQPYDGCLSAQRSGAVSFSDKGGLPYSPVMKGGAYTNNMSAPGGIAGFAQIDRDASHCMPNHANPATIGSSLLQSGGAATGAGGGSMAASASPILEQHPAAYTTAPSQFNNSVGAPILLNQPLSGEMLSKACTQKAGRRRRYNKKSRKASSRKTKARKTKH
jgi:hypothetical protein